MFRFNGDDVLGDRIQYHLAGGVRKRHRVLLDFDPQFGDGKNTEYNITQPTSAYVGSGGTIEFVHNVTYRNELPTIPINPSGHSSALKL